MRNICTLAASLFLLAVSPVGSQILLGDTAPLFVSLDQNMRRIDMGELLRDHPLVFWTTSAT